MFHRSLFLGAAVLTVAFASTARLDIVRAAGPLVAALHSTPDGARDGTRYGTSDDTRIGGLAPDDRSRIGERVGALSRESRWTLAASIPLAFKTYHPQGLVRIGNTFFASSVEIRVPTRRLPAPAGGYDRDTGEGTGHLFKIAADGQRLADLTLGEGASYHPGGIDYDGTHLWVPVAEYRPNGRSIIYRVDPATMTATKVLAFDDHIGAIVHDAATRTLHGVSWGSRRFYRWTLDAQGRVTNAAVAPERLRRLNPSHYVDYQDCKSAGAERMLCTGVADLRRADGPPLRLGGLDLIDLKDGRPLHQVPVLLWTKSGLPMTQNAVWLEPAAAGSGAGLRGYFLPEDDEASTIYVYDVATP